MSFSHLPYSHLIGLSALRWVAVGHFHKTDEIEDEALTRLFVRKVLRLQLGLLKFIRESLPQGTFLVVNQKPVLLSLPHPPPSEED